MPRLPSGLAGPWVQDEIRSVSFIHLFLASLSFFLVLSTPQVGALTS